MQNPRREHHILPRLYLKGFIEPGSRWFVWEYERRGAFDPGPVPRRHNPCRTPVASAGMEKDAYAYTRLDGTNDFDSIEKQLELLEKPTNPVCAKIRQQQPISLHDKALFATYVGYMWKRVLARGARAEKQWPAIVQDENVWKDARRELANRGVSSQQAERVIAALRPSFEREMPREIALKSMVEPLPMFTGGLTQMPWTFLVASGVRQFVTSDNPVVLMGATALGDPNVELLFPVGSGVTLSARWRRGRDLAYAKSSQARIRQINKAVAANATKHLYYHAAEAWVLALVAA